jgi:uncharacterized protein YjbI with pentapeptide repeats
MPDANTEEPLIVDLHGAFLRRTDLSRANLAGADFSFATLRGANLKDANLRGTILRGADLSEAKNLTRAQLEEAVIDHETKLPGYLREEAP